TSDNFFENELYSNYKFQGEVDQSIQRLSGSLQEKAKKVKYVPTAAWLAWSGATNEVARYLNEAGSKTVVFVLYMIPTRDCNAGGSNGGADNLSTYQGYVNSIYNTINQYPNSRIVMIIEPDTIGNLVTANNANCRNVHDMHKQALSYAISKFGTQKNVRVYLDAAHGGWLNSSADRTAEVIAEILRNAGNGKIRGISTNVSNYQPVYSEYQYHQNLNRALESRGVRGMKFIVDTSRNGRNPSSATWCNLKGAGLGARPQANPDPNMPLLDAYVWIKTPGESDSASSADPVCRNSDSLQGAPAAGSWFHDYFVMLLENANPPF
nr:Chain A, Glucanase [Orpinomyces sp. Y102]5JX5_B Chain B, Glucanase [Orpinomyces sp. Y102]5JX5_C Chain C, Glucanase [Orpinomyces sp. Y102]5JX5_D Chain D, Glucanase [Orpinomyces sp. Y102]6IDW_A Chain A, Glucanase [Orpinomyces sp. Y102]6IDW_B Chain B, Glucanase [Orpinomyces sp. Y102]6IDW_C Chain C, Glucanase [Orpinomyces sp. Y102]6IDW_D Chain D, Glucanase [Orpinomyces sp. Y102]